VGGKIVFPHRQQIEEGKDRNFLSDMQKKIAMMMMKTSKLQF
jgi:hypothetical protein